VPNQKQAIFLALPHKEAFYGGAGGGGKSVALLMGALQFVDVSGYHAILFRRTYPQLTKPDGLIPLAHSWLGGTRAQWNEQKHEWTFPSGATLTFDAIQYEQDKYKHQGPSYHFIGFDELTGFARSMFTYLFTRLRKTVHIDVPLRMRGGSNPGNVGHDWVKQRYITEGRAKGRIFVPAKLEDNPHMDAESYVESLEEVDPITRAQMRHGNWDVRPEGGLFKRTWFENKVLNRADIPMMIRLCRYWDLAATPVGENGNDDPDHTAGLLLGLTEDKTFAVLDVQRFRGTPLEVKRRMRATADRDGRAVEVLIEQEGGSQAKIAAQDIVRDTLSGFNARAVRPRGSKVERSKPMQAVAERGDLYLLQGQWIGDFLDELCSFGTETAHDDQVDALTGAHEALAGGSDWGGNEWAKIVSYEEQPEKYGGGNGVREMLLKKLRGEG
jgi:predicted phage terminase large subunit-like protein